MVKVKEARNSDKPISVIGHDPSQGQFVASRFDEGHSLVDLDSCARRARAGEKAAQNRLYEVARVRLSKIALALGVSPDDVSDLVQDVLLASWQRLDRFDPEQGSFISWLVPGLVGRARNRSRSLGRREHFFGRFREVLKGWRESRPRPQDASDARLTLDRLLRTLTPRQREVIALYEIEGMSASEAGAVLGMKTASVRSIARDARQRLSHEARREVTP